MLTHPTERDRSEPTECPRCCQDTARIIGVYERGYLRDVIMWCSDCDDDSVDGGL